MKVFTIYKATNTVNGKVYIGFDSSWPKRISGHKISSQIEDTKFYRAIRKYGFDCFSWEAIYQSLDKEHTLKTMEPYFIKEYNSKEQGYNSTLGGDGNTGFSPSQEQRERMSKAQKGLKKPGSGNFNPRTPEQIAEFLEHAKRFAHTPEARAKRSVALKGKKKSESHIESMKTRWQDNTKITCPHCNKTGEYKNMMRWHMERCKYNPDKLQDLPCILICEHCQYSCKVGPNFYRYHGKNCKLFTESLSGPTICPILP